MISLERWLGYAGVVLAAAALAEPLTRYAGWPAAAPIVGLAVVWIGGIRYRQAWTETIPALYVLAAPAGFLWFEVSIWNALAAILFSLIAWDLQAFDLRTRSFEGAPAREALVRRHIKRLLEIIGAGAALAAVALLNRVELGFWAALIWALILVLGLGMAISYLRRMSD